MVERESQNFRFRIDEMNPDALFQDEIGQQKVEKLSLRVTILSILLPCLMAIILFLGYWQLKESISGIQNTGTDQFQKLSENFKERFDKIETGQSQLENTLNLKVSQLEKEILFVKENLKKTDLKLVNAQKTLGNANRNLSEVKSGTVTKAAFQKAVRNLATLEKKITKDLPKGLDEKLKAQSKQQKESLAKEMSVTRKVVETFRSELSNVNDLLSSAQTDLDDVRSELGDMSEIKMDRKELALTLLNEQQRFQERLDQNTRQTKKQVEGLMSGLERLQALENQIKEVKGTLNKLKARPSAATNTRASALSTPATSVPPQPPLPTSVQVEQDLRK